MKLSSFAILFATAAYVSAYPLSQWRKRDVDPSIVPDFGFESGVNPTGTGDCDGAPGTNVKIPCFCPPPRDVMLKALNENIAAGHCVNNTVVSFDFPTDNSIQSEISRINGVLVTLQNLRGPGVGCPAASTTLNARRKALQDQLASGNTNLPAATVTPVATTSTPAPAATTTAVPAGSTDFRAQVAALAPELGFESGVNPDGTGNCDGAIPGGPKIPCQCPPPRDEFISQLQNNAVAGKAVNNPDVKVDFPLDDSVASKKARIIASLITIQNLRGPGVGCPAVSTTLSQQLEALD
ncbi:hypothetical protein FRC00_012506 [Tulasnella sp. 408]|nr:hypothetical protein FRC00_012506 [Tulasnella sp. 408]